jgi:putative ABC transport system permease protein
MSGTSPRPSRLLIRVLGRVLSVSAAHAVAGDLLEELEARTQAGRPPRSPGLWLHTQMVLAALAGLRVGAPRWARSSAHLLRDAWRALRRSPAHAMFILVVLAVAIAVATLTFSVVDAVVLRPLPFDQSDRLVQIAGRTQRGPAPLHAEQFWPVHDHVPALERVASLMRWKSGVTVGDSTEQMEVMNCTAELFEVLRLTPVLGRVWTTEEETRSDRHVAVISFRLWQRRFGGDPSVLGRAVRVESESYRVIGVLDASADAAQTIGWSNQIWIPRVPSRAVSAGPSPIVAALGRLRGDATPQLVEAQMRSALAPVHAAKPAAYTEWEPRVALWQDALVGTARGWMLLVLGTVVLVVLIGCVNAANAMLARSVDRARELAVRASLGASRRQIALSLLVESLLLSFGAAACALLFAAWGIRAAKAALPLGLFRADTIALNGRVLTASILAAVLTGLLFGMVPAWLASRVSIVALLKDSGTTATSARRRWRTGLLVGQIACISVLLVVSTLFVASFIRTMQIDLGVQRSSLLAVAARFPFKIPVDAVQSQLKRVPGIADVAVVTYASLPLVGPAFHGAFPTTKLRPAGPRGGGEAVEVLTYRVTSNYFDVTGMRFKRGSAWSGNAGPDPLPAVLDEAAAEQLFGDRDPLGLQVAGEFFDDRVYKDRSAIFTVVGVVPYVYSRGPEGNAPPGMYLPIVDRPSRIFAALVARTVAPPATLVPVVERALAPVAPENPESYIHAFDEAFDRLTATRRFSGTLMFSFAVFALVIGAAGIYGVLASIVAQRTREIGVRMALGATVADIRRGLLGDVGRYLTLGLALGLPVAWWVSRGFGTLFFQVRPGDLAIYVVVAAMLAAVALIAAIVPARRASRVDPIVSLRVS